MPRLTLARRSRFVSLAFVAAMGAALACSTPAARPRVGGELPKRLSDTEFWSLSERASEPSGTFHSDNFISNENLYQTVIPDLIARVQPGGLYLGVGPEQNFTYITATRPGMAIIVDLRRGNLQEHLLYKALLELSGDRAEFLSKLFSRPKPAGLGPTSSATQLFAAFEHAASSETMYRATLDAVMARLTKTHGFALHADDAAGIDFIFRSGFFAEGADLMYRRSDFLNAGRRPTYAELMTMDDGHGQQRSYLASEENFAFLKSLEERNLLVPVVGDFGGPKALRAVGDYARQLGTSVSTFYLSNVEMYLRQDGKWETFCANVAAMPLDASSTFIRSHPTAFPRGFSSGLGAMAAETKGCAAAKIVFR